jgi:hypothetical protein
MTARRSPAQLSSYRWFGVEDLRAFGGLSRLPDEAPARHAAVPASRACSQPIFAAVAASARASISR